MNLGDNQTAGQQSLIKLLLIGDGKCGKSHYAGMAAKAGFKVLYLDGDVALPTLKSLEQGARKNIFYLGVHDQMDGGSRSPDFFTNFTKFVTEIRFRWNVNKGRLATRNDTEDTIWEIQPGKLDHTCLLIIDSWSSYVESVTLAAADAENVNLNDATTNQMRPVYQMGGNKATQALAVIRALKCHVIVIAHPDEYQHKVAPDGKKIKDVKENELVIEYTKRIPKSTSRPAALQMSKYFTDIAWMNMNPAGTERRLDFRSNPDAVSGGHFEGWKSVDEYSFVNLVKLTGGYIPTGNESTEGWLKVIEPGDTPPETQEVLDGTKQTTVHKVSGMSSFMKKA